MSVRRRVPAVLGGAVALALVLAAAIAALRAARPPEPLEGIRVLRPPHEVSALALWRGSVWAGGRDGLHRLDPATGALLPVPSCDPPLRFVSALAVRDPGEGLWIGHPGGLTLFDGRRYRTFTVADGLPDDRVECLMVTRDGALWAGTWGGAVRFRGAPRRELGASVGLASDMVRVMMQDASGGVWFGSYVAPAGGLSVPEGEGWRVVTPREGLPHPNVTAIVEVAPGEVWVGTGLLDRGGLAVFGRDEGRWRLRRILRRRDGLAGEKVRAIHRDGSGVYWISSEYDGVLVKRDGKGRVLTRREGLPDDEVKAFLEAPDGGLWLGTRDGIAVIEPGFAVRFLAEDAGERP